MRCELAFISLLISISALSQTNAFPPLIDKETARQHALPCHDASIPPIAKAAHAFGDVTLQVGVSPLGKVLYATPLDGPSMDQGAAADYILDCGYHPFLVNGQPSLVEALVNVSFSPASPVGGENYGRVPEKVVRTNSACILAERNEHDLHKVADTCGAAAKAADTLPTLTDCAGRRITYVQAATAYLRAQNFAEALVEANKAVAVADTGHDTGYGIASAHFARAEAFFVLHELTKAEDDLVIAESAERRMIATIQSDSLKKRYSAALKQLLMLDSRVLRASGKTADADAKEKEAAAL